MATKPTVRIPLWASGGTTTDPGGSKEAEGWITSERPPANWWNWVLNAIGQWLEYFEERTDLSPTVIGRATAGGSAAVDYCSAPLAVMPIAFYDNGYEMRIFFDSAVVGTQPVVVVSGGNNFLGNLYVASMVDASTLSIYAYNAGTQAQVNLSGTGIDEINFVIYDLPT